MGSRKNHLEEIMQVSDKNSWNTEEYLEFLEETIKRTNERYSKEYKDIQEEFSIDSSVGSVPIQKLIEPDTVEYLVETLEVKGKTDQEIVNTIHDYILNEYHFIHEPFDWPTVDETIFTKKGDCNSLSLLMMSLLLASGIDKDKIYGSISYNHMWVNVFYEDKWHILETDKNAERLDIYKTEGIYDYPLFKIFSDRTQKRKKKL